MKNPATHTYRDQLNAFTNLIAANQRFGAKTQVLLRNGSIVEPIYKHAEDGTCGDAFFTEDYEYCWNLDGTSVTNHNFDMMEII